MESTKGAEDTSELFKKAIAVGTSNATTTCTLPLHRIYVDVEYQRLNTIRRRADIHAWTAQNLIDWRTARRPQSHVRHHFNKLRQQR